jgi:hypothetical protein
VNELRFSHTIYTTAVVLTVDLILFGQLRSALRATLLFEVSGQEFVSSDFAADTINGFR